jgi:hypothetical protein
MPRNACSPGSSAITAGCAREKEKGDAHRDAHLFPRGAKRVKKGDAHVFAGRSETVCVATCLFVQARKRSASGQLIGWLASEDCFRHWAATPPQLQRWSEALSRGAFRPDLAPACEREGQSADRRRGKFDSDLDIVSKPALHELALRQVLEVPAQERRHLSAEEYPSGAPLPPA